MLQWRRENLSFLSFANNAMNLKRFKEMLSLRTFIDVHLTSQDSQMEIFKIPDEKHILNVIVDVRNYILINQYWH